MKIMNFKLPIEPWIVKFVGKIDATIKILKSEIGNEKVFILEGLKMKTFNGLYDEFIKVLKLPDYFGRNLNALDECLTDLEWLNIDTIVLVILNANDVLSDEPDYDYGTIIEILNDASVELSESVENGEEWDRGAIAFHTIIHSEKEGIVNIDKLPKLDI